MIIRAMSEKDFEEINEIHEKFYAREFTLPDLTKFLGAFVVTNDSNEIITAGGIRPIIESVIVTNKDISIEERRLALYQMLHAQMFTCARIGFTELHASIVNDKKWKQHLIKSGFRPIKGEMLVIDVG